MRVVTGRLADTTGQGVKGAIVVLMEKADSVQVRWDYFAVDTFRLEYEYRKEKALLLYVSAIGYASKYVEVDRERENQGTIVLEPLSVLLDEADRGAAGIWDVVCTAEQILISHSGTHEISVIDYPAFFAKYQQVADKNSLSYDLKFMVGLRQRIPLQGNGPRDFAVENGQAYIPTYFSDTLNIVNLKNNTSLN